uniref:Uncharacterized protein n=1 Tax=Panagrolaimus sp. PS1159 TaxID=55785 RepID=A0AC35FMF0_9BILA
MRTQTSTTYHYRDDEKLIQENYLLRRKILEMENERGTFGALYAKLLEDFQTIFEENKNYKVMVEQLEKDITTLQDAVNNITMRGDDATINSFNESYRTSKIADILNREFDPSRPSPSNTKEKEKISKNNKESRSSTNCRGKSFLTLGSTERTLQQQNRLRELVRRSLARRQAIETASVRRSRITAQMKNLVVYELTNSEYFDSATYDALQARLNAIEAFPFEQMRNDTIRRLTEFGYFEKAKKEQIEKFHRAVRAVYTQAMVDNNRRQFMNDGALKNLRLDNFRKRIE